MTDPNERGEGKEGVPGIPGLSEALAALTAHNAGQGEGARMGRVFGTMLRQAAEGAEEPDMAAAARSATVEADQETHVGLTRLQAAHGAALQALGLSLAHETSNDPDRAFSGRVVLRVTDADALMRALPGALPSDEKSIAALAEALAAQVRTTDPDDVPPAERAVLGRLSDLSRALHEAAPSLTAKKLDRYAEFQAKGKLRAYLAVEQENLWIERGEGFGPADWVADATPERLEEMWKKALASLAQQDRDPEHGVGPELREHLLTSIAASAERLKTVSWPPQQKERMHAVLVKYTNELIGGLRN